MGTRGSALALAQSGWVARELERLTPGLEVETVAIKTSGDISLASPSRFTKGLFIKEIEEALLRAEIDLAVHSAKDMPASLAPGLLIAAYPKREDPRDVLIARDGLSWAGLGPGVRVGTSSLRRGVQLALARPGVEVIAMRGNVDTRLRKLQEGALDALILAAAGLRRLGRGDAPHEIIPEDRIVPAPGQGALAVEAREERPDLAELLASLDCSATRREVELERALLKALGGGCTTPLGVLGRARGEVVEVSVFWSEPDGGRALRLQETCRDLSRGEEFAQGLARRVHDAV